MIRKADRIYAIKAGRVLQQGTFEELANTEDLFGKVHSSTNGLISLLCRSRHLLCP